MFICTLATLKKYLKKSKMEIEKDISKVLKHASACRIKAEKQKIWMMNFLTSTLYLFARLTLILIFSFCYLLLVFKKLIFRSKTLLNYIKF